MQDPEQQEHLEDLPTKEEVFRPNREMRRNRRILGHGLLPLAVIGKPGSHYNGGKRWHKNVGRR